MVQIDHVGIRHVLAGVNGIERLLLRLEHLTQDVFHGDELVVVVQVEDLLRSVLNRVEKTDVLASEVVPRHHLHDLVGQLLLILHRQVHQVGPIDIVLHRRLLVRHHHHTQVLFRFCQLLHNDGWRIHGSDNHPSVAH